VDQGQVDPVGLYVAGDERHHPCVSAIVKVIGMSAI